MSRAKMPMRANEDTVPAQERSRDPDASDLRPLKVFAFDPSGGRRLGNVMTVEVENRSLRRGPAEQPEPAKDGAPVLADLVEVIDFDATHDCFYTPVDLDTSSILMRGGLNPSEADVRFHQQMVYAVVRDTIHKLESALGRRIHWFRMDPPGPETIGKLRIVPHALFQANAFYSREAKALLFGYFRADATAPGSNLPGQIVYSCLSHDIVAHETTHAVVDGIRAHFSEPTNGDVAAFHEAFADLVALFRHFSYSEALFDTIQKTGGVLYQAQLQPAVVGLQTAAPAIVGEQPVENPLVVLAKQFGDACGMNGGLRSAIGTPPDSHAIEWTTEPHQRGSILVAAVFDAYFSCYLKRVANLFRIAGVRPGDRELPVPLVEELVAAASALADRFLVACVRAIDYCPPVDITFGDYLRALVTSSCDLDPDDPDDMRDALIHAFRAREIRPAGVLSFGEESLRWPAADASLPPVKGLAFGTGRGLSSPEKDQNARLLRRYVETHAGSLGLDPDLRGSALTIPSFHPIHRRTRGLPRVDMVVEIVQTRWVSVESEGRAVEVPYRGGTVLLIDESGTVRYTIASPIHDPKREARHKGHWVRRGVRQCRQEREGAFHLNFAAVHGGRI